MHDKIRHILYIEESKEGGLVFKDHNEEKKTEMSLRYFDSAQFETLS